MKLLLLSHTPDNSHFKIGSHHYAEKLMELGCDVYYAGVPNTIFHQMFKPQVNGVRKINSSVSIVKMKTLFPITLSPSIFTMLFNRASFNFYKSNSLLVSEFFDAVICDYPYFHPILRKIKYNKLIYRPTDDYFSMGGEKVVSYESKMCSDADFIICTSDVVSKKISERYNVDLSKVSTISNGYDDDVFYVRTSDLIGRKNAVYIGALDNRFDFGALYHLASNNNDVIFDIYGPINDSLKDEVNKVNVLGNVNFLGAVDYNQTGEILNGYKVGLLLLTDAASNKGRSPMKLWEYISSGLNVLYSNIEGVEKLDCVVEYKGMDDLLESFQHALKIECDTSLDALKSKTWQCKANQLYQIIKK